jgi:hypothetical protein
MPALVTIHQQPHLRAFHRHLGGAGKPKIVTWVAVMRKLVGAT